MKNVVIPKFTGDNFTEKKEYEILARLGFCFVEVANDAGEIVRISLEDNRFKFIF